MIGFIGLGELGLALARNLAQSEIDLIVYDLDPRPVDELVRVGAQAAQSVAAVGSVADTVFVCVAEDHQLLDVVDSPGGLLRQMKSGGLVVAHGTFSPGVVEGLAHKADLAGIEVIDAPLTAGRGRVEDRSAVFFVGGSAGGIEKCRELLEISASHLVIAGSSGAGSKLKLVHQLILCTNVMAAYEGWSLGRGFGLDDGVILEMIRAGAAQSRQAERWSMVGDNISNHTTKLWAKDLRLCLEAAGGLDLELPGTEHVERLIERIAGN